ncbi:MAG: hypothetical protein M0P47_02465 [Bacteroidales bacterium]|nr:hypothetical protein [Bacteroidales bacterium]
MRKFLLLFLFIPVFLASQTIFPIDGHDFPDAIVPPSTLYDIDAAWSYLNTGMDLYLEFGFKSVMVQEIIWENAKVKAEVYLMGSPEEAFGIYSLSVIKCQQRDTINPYDCNNQFQYQAAYGNLYILITGESGMEQAKKYFLPVAQILMKKNQQNVLTLPAPFNLSAFKPSRYNLAYLQGPIGLQNCMFPFQDLFLGVRFQMFATLLTQMDLDIYFTRISFQTPGDMLQFLGYAGLMDGNIPVSNTNNNDGLYREYQQVDAQTIYFLQSQEPYPISRLINQGK